MHLSNLGRTLRGSIPSNIVYPTGTVIPYSGANPGIAGWNQYGSVTTSRNLFCNQTGRGSSFLQSSTGPRFRANISTTGSGHDFNPAFNSRIAYNASSISAFPNSGFFGAHAHSSVYSSVATNLRPASITYNFLISTQEQTVLPPNSLVFGNGLQSYGTAISRSVDTFINGSSGATGTITDAITQQLLVSTTSSAGSHTHMSGQGGIETILFGSSTTYLPAASGGHTHSFSVNTRQLSFGPAVIVRMFRLLNSLPPTRDVIVGYIGDPLLIKYPWFHCNGENGTINLNGRFLALNNNRAAGSTIEAGPVEWFLPSTPPQTFISVNAPHNHQISEVTNKLSISGIGHIQINWGHQHYISEYTYDSTPIIPGGINMQFIQYKG
jgi:hypothetical protein